MLLGILNSQAAGGGVAGGFDLLETTTLTSNASSVSFSGLDAFSNYKHLQLRINGKFSSSMRLQLNGDTGSSYSWHQIYGDGSGALNPQGASNQSSITLGESMGYTTGGALIIDILDFSSTNKNTTVKNLFGTAERDFVGLSSGGWYSTNAVTSLLLYNGTHYANSTYSLYGMG
ncbi:hypothetical protein N9262_02325 [Akkermansiaceae bacterium]|nr:hypothetical protein [Akkermansiaceae bacterium]